MNTTTHAVARLAALSLAALAPPVISQQQLLMTGNDTVAASGPEWAAARSIPAGAQMVLLYGSPEKPGPYIFRVKFPAGYKLPPHRHPDERAVTVLQGNYWSAAGETFDQSKLKKFGPRDYYTTDANVAHFAWAETDVVIQEMGMGPVATPIEYVNQADDPRK